MTFVKNLHIIPLVSGPSSNPAWEHLRATASWATVLDSNALVQSAGFGSDLRALAKRFLTCGAHSDGDFPYHLFPGLDEPYDCSYYHFPQIPLWFLTGLHMADLISPAKQLFMHTVIFPGYKQAKEMQKC